MSPAEIKTLGSLLRAGETDLPCAQLQANLHLLQHRFSGNYTALMLAAEAENQALADQLIALGASLDFISAIALNRLEAVHQMLHDHPAIIHKRTPISTSPLHIAAAHASPESLSLLIDHGADVNDGAGTRWGTPLFRAATIANAELLLNAGAQINARAKHGFTPLHCAIHSSEKYVAFLLGHGADPALQTNARQTPWTLAVRHGRRSIVQLLMQFPSPRPPQQETLPEPAPPT